MQNHKYNFSINLIRHIFITKAVLIVVLVMITDLRKDETFLVPRVPLSSCVL